MEQRFVKYLHDTFKWLVEKYGFIKAGEINQEETYWVEYRSNIFTIKIEKYRREFYITLYKTGNLDKAVELFNLLSYLNQSGNTVPIPNYFESEEDLDESYKNQLNHLSTTIHDNFTLINDFFKSEILELKLGDIREFMLNKYPALFKKA